LFSVGDKVVYPMHGAGVVESIEEKEVLGSRQNYYVLKFSAGEMKVMIPMDNAYQIGLRGIIDKNELAKVYEILKEPTEGNSANWNRRYTDNLEKIKSGDIIEIAQVVKNLMQRSNEKGLSAGEKKMLESAQRMLISEVGLVEGIDITEASELVENCLC